MARNKRLHVEMALVKMAYINRATTLSQNPIAEKKTADEPVAEVKQNTSAPVIAVQKPVEPKSVESKPTQPTATTPPTTQILVTPPTENKVSTPVAPSKGKLGLPLSSKYNIASIPKKEELQSQVNEESAQTNDSVSQLTQENLDATWKAYYEKVTSPSVKSVFKHAEVSVIDEDSILIKVGSTMGKGMVQQEYELMNFIRINLNHPKLILEVEIDTTKVPVVNKPKPTKLSSPAEKYNKIIEINPMVEELRKRFDLKMDKDN
jgi:DNA polymerase-3 subunit gamma/tau